MGMPWWRSSSSAPRVGREKWESLPHVAAVLARLLDTTPDGTYHLAGQEQATWYELTCELYRRLGMATPVEAAKSSELPRPAPRLRFAALTTIQSPCIRLPVWQEGVAEYASCILAVKPNVHSAR